MTRLEEIEKAVLQLDREELARFRAWFAELDERLWDEQLQQDARGGKLDDLARKALREHGKGLTTNMPH